MEPLVFAVTWQRNAEPIGARLSQLVAAVAEAAQIRVIPRVALSYGELSRLLRERLADVAWLPPVAFVTLWDARIVTPLVSHIRAAKASYESVLLVRKDSNVSSIGDLNGKIAGWVDPWSAAGYVLPRVELLGRGADPRTLFVEERFFGSHDAAVRALLDGRADVIGTFAEATADGTLVRGSFSNVPGAQDQLRMLARFGPIPCDVIAAHTSLPQEKQRAIADALVRIASEPRWAEALGRVFGVDEFRPGPPTNYDALRATLLRGRASGLID